MNYTTSEYIKLLDWKSENDFNPEVSLSDFYCVPTFYYVSFYDKTYDNWVLAYRYPFKKLEEAEDYINHSLSNYETKIIIYRMAEDDCDFPPTINWEESKKDGVWRTDDWE